ncbi:MAG: glycosyl hydrolase family 5, partial [Oscillospiraceae bacterium]|nr:glycosyl hydrolase family 5 [Oscillospiraceae bacterium]
MKTFNGYKRGVDLGGWLSQCCHEKAHYDTFIGRSDIEKIASWGLDHVRLPVDYNLVEDGGGNPIEEGYKYID